MVQYATRDVEQDDARESAGEQAGADGARSGAAPALDPSQLGAAAPAAPPPENRETVFDIRDLTARYGQTPAIDAVSIAIHKNLVTAVIGLAPTVDTTTFSQLVKSAQPAPVAPQLPTGELQVVVRVQVQFELA